MQTDGVGFFRLLQSRMDWAAQRQSLLAENIANADTPGWRSRDLVPFAQIMARTSPPLARTAPGQMAGNNSLVFGRTPRPANIAPDGNAVSMDDQLAKIANTDGDQRLAVQLYTTYLGMFRTALGLG